MHILRGCARFVAGLVFTISFLVALPSASHAITYLNQASVRVSWTPSSQADTKGYEVHRATTSGGTFSKISTTLVAGTSWLDTAVSNGGAYYYRLKAVDTSGNVSALSTAVSDGAFIDLTAPSVSASPAAGSYSTSINITLQASETSTIYYTKDGSNPTTASAVYTTPILVTATTTLKYFAVDRASNQSPVVTGLYTINASSTDSDGDGYSNSLEQSMGTNPYDAMSQPKASSVRIDPVGNPLQIGSTVQLKVTGTFRPATGTAIDYNLASLVSYSVDSPAVSVSTSGLAAGKADGSSNVTAKQIINGVAGATSNSIKITVDSKPPRVDANKTRPYNKQGTATDIGPVPRVPIDTGIVIRVVDDLIGENIGIDEGSIILLVNQTEVPAKVREIKAGDAHEFDIAYQHQGNFQYDQIINITLELADMAGNTMTFIESFQVESLTEHQWADSNTPPQTALNKIDGTAELSVVPASDSISDELLKGAKITYYNTELVKPRVGPVGEIDPLDIATPLGIPLNVEPVTVFDRPITVRVPVPGAQLKDTNGDGKLDAGLEMYDVYFYSPLPNVLWRSMADASDWIVAESRINHYETQPATIEVKVIQPGAVQVGTAGSVVGLTPNIKINGQDGPVYASRTSRLSITLSLSNSTGSQVVDWWVLADTPKGWYSFDLDTRTWSSGMNPSRQAAPADFPAQEVFSDVPPFGAGKYTLYFGIDNNADGKPDGTYRDSVYLFAF